MKYALALVAFLLACMVQIDDDGGGTGTASTMGTADSVDTTAGPGEDDLCARAARCSLLGPGISEADCIDLETMCTGELLMSQLADWEELLGNCLDLENCVNFSDCVLVLPDCPPRDAFGGDPDNCDPICDFCWVNLPAENMCPIIWNGTGDGCDCGCQFVDLDC